MGRKTRYAAIKRRRIVGSSVAIPAMKSSIGVLVSRLAKACCNNELRQAVFVGVLLALDSSGGLHGQHDHWNIHRVGIPACGLPGVRIPHAVMKRAFIAVGVHRNEALDAGELQRRSQSFAVPPLGGNAMYCAEPAKLRQILGLKAGLRTTLQLSWHSMRPNRRSSGPSALAAFCRNGDLHDLAFWFSDFPDFVASAAFLASTSS
jgi:hypothetical protein